MSTPETSRGTRKNFVRLAVVETLSAVPLGYYLPLSRTALLLAVVILLALNASVFASITERAWSLPLQVSNLIIGGICLELVIGSGRSTRQVLVFVIGVLCLAQLVVGFFRLSDGVLKACCIAQQLALGSTVAFWTAIDRFRSVFEAGSDMSLNHFRMGLRSLFVAPLAFVAVVFVGSLVGWKRYFIVLAGACAGQLAIGLFELGVALQAYSIVIAGFVFLGIFVSLLLVAAMQRRHPGFTNAL